MAADTPDRIIVINPNSTEAVTQGIDKAMEPLRRKDGTQIECVTLKEGPPGIETQAHVDGVVAPLVAQVRARDNDAAAFVIACFSDPGIHQARETTRKPVLGIAECGIMAATMLGDRFGIIAIKNRSIPRHMRYVRALGLESRCAGDLAIDLSVVELADEGRTYGRMVEVGQRLRDERDAGVIVMGCAGMARYRDRLEDAIGIPVVEPSQAAAAMAIGLSRLSWTGRRAG